MGAAQWRRKPVAHLRLSGALDRCQAPSPPSPFHHSGSWLRAAVQQWRELAQLLSHGRSCLVGCTTSGSAGACSGGEKLACSGKAAAAPALTLQ